MLSEVWRTKICKQITDDVYQIETEKHFSLEEPNLYAIKCTKDVNSELIVIRPDKIKEKTKYIKDKPPKDCDYIILDEGKKSVYFIELKASSDSCPNAEKIAKQLRSGNNWLEHLMFIMKITEDVYEFKKKYYLCVKYEARQDRKYVNRPNKHGVYNFNGERLDLREIFRLPCD